METVETTQLNFVSILASFAAILFIITLGVVLLNQHFQKNMFKQELKNIELKNKHQLDLLQSSITVQENERKRIAGDLHDELGALLSISRMQLAQLEKSEVVKDDQFLKTLNTIRGYVETSLTSLRRISYELIPPQLEQFGLINTLEEIMQQLSRSQAIKIQFVHQNLPTLNWTTQIGLYRIFMELLNNTIKHSGATEVFVEFKMETNQLRCTFQDNGKGLPNKDDIAYGLGTKNIEGRVNALEGTLTIGGAQVQGFRAEIVIPGRAFI